ncbi:MAG: hypothetical protein M1833_003088 [Piccolia ochrophora]|nr:MAG: hypothetical protein M1833_003088 [Piccolia ochrophora]
MNWGLQKHGHVIMLRAWALVLLLLTAPLLYYIKPRLPPNTSGGMNLRFLRTRTFWLLQIGNILQGLGYFIPAIYLPSYARSLSLSHLSASLTVSLLNAASVVGQVTLGFLTDKVSVAVVTSISTAGSALAIFAFWGFAESLPLLAVFAVVYGLFAGGFGATWTGIIREVRRREPGAETGMMLGCLAAGRGVGNVLAGPISEALVRDGAWRAPGASGAYGSSYGALIIFTGITALLGGVGCVARWLDERGQKA